MEWALNTEVGDLRSIPTHVRSWVIAMSHFSCLLNGDIPCYTKLP